MKEFYETTAAPHRTAPLLLSLALMLAACSTSPVPSQPELSISPDVIQGETITLDTKNNLPIINLSYKNGVESLKPQVSPNTCEPNGGSTGYYSRKQSIPSYEGGQQSAYGYTKVSSLPGMSNIFLDAFPTPVPPSVPYIYMGMSSFPAFGMVFEGGLNYDRANSDWAIFLASQEGRQTQKQYSTRVNGQVWHLVPGWDAVIEVFIDQANQPVLQITGLSWNIYNVDAYGKLKRSSSLAQRKTFSFKLMESGVQTMFPGWFWNPSGGSNPTGQPIRSMVSMAYPSGSNYSGSNSGMNYVNVESYTGVINGFSLYGVPSITKKSWPRSSDSICLTKNVYDIGPYKSYDTTRSTININNWGPSHPNNSGTGGGGGGVPQ